MQRKVRTEVIQLEDTLAQVRKEYEMLRIEFEQTLAANEQAGNILFLSLLRFSQVCLFLLRSAFELTPIVSSRSFSGPINREMRHLISTLQNHNQQMKGEVVKYKLRLREAQQELNQARTQAYRL